MLSLASLISFPILTRYLPIEEYGYLSLYTTAIGLLVAMYKGGLQQSIFRYYKGDNHEIVSSALQAFLYSSFVTTVLCVAVVLIITKSADADYAYLVIFISLFQSLRSLIMSTYASQEKSLFVNFINVIYKYGSLGLMLVFIFYYEGSAKSVLLSVLLSDVLVLFFVIAKWINIFEFTFPTKSNIQLVMLYGFPLMLAEMLQMAHAFSDRFLIEYYLGIAEVASYVAPYSISKIISDVVFGGVATALVPIYMSLWKAGDIEGTKRFLNKVSDYYLLIFFKVL